LVSSLVSPGCGKRSRIVFLFKINPFLAVFQLWEVIARRIESDRLASGSWGEAGGSGFQKKGFQIPLANGIKNGLEELLKYFNPLFLLW